MRVTKPLREGLTNVATEHLRHDATPTAPPEGAAKHHRGSMPVNALTHGESESARFATLFDKHADAIYNYCYRRTANRTDAEDVLSAVFLQAWNRRARTPTNEELPWLYGIATNVIRNHWRSQRRFANLLVRISRERTGEGQDVEGRGEDARAERLVEAIGQLRRTERDVFVLCAWEGLSYEDTAKALGIPVGTVRSRLSRARQKLRELSTQGRT
jgi:RNA polymerase sigma factor (sigma-70 family)